MTLKPHKNLAAEPRSVAVKCMKVRVRWAQEGLKNEWSRQNTHPHAAAWEDERLPGAERRDQCEDQRCDSSLVYDACSRVGPLPQEQVEVFEVNRNVDRPIPGMPFAGEMVRPC